MLNFANYSGKEKIELYRSVLEIMENIGGIVDIDRLMKIAQQHEVFQNQADFSDIINELIERGYLKLKIRRAKDEDCIVSCKFRPFIDVVRV